MMPLVRVATAVMICMELAASCCSWCIPASADYVTGLDPLGDHYLSFRSGPGGNPFVELDRSEVFLLKAAGAWRRDGLDDGPVGWVSSEVLSPGHRTTSDAGRPPKRVADSPATQAAQCRASRPGPGYTAGGVRYVLTNKVYGAHTNIEEEVRSKFGPAAALADWRDLKRVLRTKEDAINFVREVGLEPQGSNYVCRNYYVRLGPDTQTGGKNYLMAVHNGVRPHDWLVLDEIGGNHLHLGRWNNPAQILVQLRDTAPPQTAYKPPQPSQASAESTVSQQRVAESSVGGKPRQYDIGTRIALVIGNSNYSAVPPLRNPRQDAQALADALRSAGLTSVTVVSDATRAEFIQALNTFSDRAEKADWAVVYYAGHGVEVGGTNYLVPVDARLRADRDVQDEAISLDRVTEAIGHAKKLRLVILDACRDNPFAQRMRRTVATRSIGRGLVAVEPEGGTLVAYAAKHGHVALDGDGKNSPFVSALVRRLATPGLEINKLFRLVRDDVLAATGKQQEPYVYGSLPGEDFFFRPPQAN